MVQLNNTFEQLRVSDAGPAQQHRPSRPAKVALRVRSGAEDAQGEADAGADSSSRLLSLLSRLFSPLRRSPNFSSTLQHVKGLLYEKEYLAAFGTDTEEGERWREVYAARWVPARAVIYERIFEECGIARHLGWDTTAVQVAAREQTEEEELAADRQRARLRRQLRQEGRTGAEIDAAVAKLDQELLASRTGAGMDRGDDGAGATVETVMIGAGAGSEVVALGAVLGQAALASERETTAIAPKRPRVKVQAIDQGSWDVLLDKMAAGLREDWPVLGSAGGDDESAEEAFQVDFIKGDVLAKAPAGDSAATPLSALPDFSSPSLRLVTICFTITELLLQSRVATLRLFSDISRSAPRGTLLLIVESASLALIPLGKEGRTYPLGKLLDHALAGANGDGAWEVVESEDAKWYRMPEDADEVYNEMGKGTRVKLENSRVVLRLYRKR
ncbi:hypothetical protein BMF94_4638 [Rhodotorula taiwanensis]|uniref:Uncharacterized protein n=1 Tax=Rhodotorula taiwanensis TaxID=741276 RepID=A0A2S5B6F9_9BASI|nr:hypothetical protein BMF94_4638 [Rhodotorula taiwanensis]